MMKRISWKAWLGWSVLVVPVAFAAWVYWHGWRPLPSSGPIPLYSELNRPEYSRAAQRASTQLSKLVREKNLPSLSIAIGYKGELLWTGVAGFRDLENHIAAKTTTRYRIGGASQAVTSTAIAWLVDRDSLDLDTSLNGKIPGYRTQPWDFTMRQLLSHTAGLPHYGDLKLRGLCTTLCNCRQFTSVAEALTVFNTRKLLFPPGTRFHYSAFDPVLASAVVDSITGKPFLDFLADSILTPYGLKNTVGDHSPADTLPTARFYETKAGRFRPWKSLNLGKEVNLSYQWASEGLLSTPEDLVRLGNAILTDKIFSRSTKAAFFQLQRLEDKHINEQHYALGWRSSRTSAARTQLSEAPLWIVHNGGNSQGSQAYWVLFPELDLVVAAMSNTRSDNFDRDFAREILQLAGYFTRQIRRKENSTKARR